MVNDEPRTESTETPDLGKAVSGLTDTAWSVISTIEYAVANMQRVFGQTPLSVELLTAAKQLRRAVDDVGAAYGAHVHELVCEAQQASINVLHGVLAGLVVNGPEEARREVAQLLSPAVTKGARRADDPAD